MASLAVKKKPLTDREFLARLEISDTIRNPEFSHIREKIRRNTICHTGRSRLVSEMRTSYCAESLRILSEADSALNNTFTILGFPPHRFAGQIDWSTDFVSGLGWTSDYYLSVPIVRWNDTSDIKVPWELSRGHYLATLAQAWYLTRKQSYAAKFTNLIESWMRDNQYLRGPNWTCPMEAAIRMVNWVAAAEILAECDGISDRFWFNFYLCLYQHAEFIEENLEFISRGMNTNHYLSNLMGLLLAGQVFDCPSAEIWRNYALSELEKEIKLQTYPDGFCYESSLNYHQLTTEIMLVSYAIGRGEDTFSSNFRRQLERMIQLIHTLQKPDGTLPNFGDDDSGRILVLDARPIQEPGKLRELGADLLGRTDLMRSDRQPMEARWLAFGQTARISDSNRDERSADRVSSAFGDSGLGVMRNDDLYIFVTANNVGTGGLGNHKHNDLLSIEVSDGKTNYIVDSGTYTYTSNPTERNHYRSTSHHSVPSVQGRELNRLLPKMLFALRKDGDVRITRWESCESYDHIEARHTAYERLSNPAVISRAVHFDKKGRFFVVLDRFRGMGGDHTFNNSLIIGDATVAESGDSIVLRSRVEDGKRMTIRSLNAGWSRTTLDHEISKCYGSKQPAQRVLYSVRAAMPCHMLWAGIPAQAEDHADKLNDEIDTVLRLLCWERFKQPIGSIKPEMATA